MTSTSRNADRKAEIVATAAQLFDEAGFYQVSMEDIAEANGIRKPTLYHYFAGKDDVLSLIHEEFINLLLDRHEARLPSHRSACGDLLEVIADIIELMHTHHGHVRVFFEHHRELPADRLGPIKEKRDRYFQGVMDIIQRGVDDGEFATANIPLTTLAVFGMCNWAYTWYSPDGPLSTREVAIQLWALLHDGLGTGDRGRSDGGHKAVKPPSTT